MGRRVYIIVFLSVLIGLLDGLGLSMFLPLLNMVDQSTEADPTSLGKLQFLVMFIKDMGISLSVLSVLLVMLFFFIGKGCILYITGVYKVDVQQWFITKLRNENLFRLVHIKYSYFLRTNSGKIQNTLTGEINKVANSFLNYFDTLQYGILVLVFMSFAFFIDFQFALLVSLGGLLSNFLFRQFYKLTRIFSEQITEEGHVFQNLLIQKVGNFKYLKATGLLYGYYKKLKLSVSKMENLNRKMGKMDAFLTAVREPILIAVVIVVIYIKISLLNAELGPILLSLLFFYRALSYLMLMQLRYNKFLALEGSLNNVKSWEEELKGNREEKGTFVIEEEIKTLQLRNVCFRLEETEILKDINLDIGPDETIALVGESGSGKTTLLNILSGLVQVSGGTFEINGIDSDKIDFSEYHKRIGYITQDPVIFNDSVFNNVTFWEKKTVGGEQRFWKALEKAAIAPFVKELPGQEDAVLGNNGINVSGGQRQRISIARELYKSAEVLLLDEATSSLDSRTENIIQERINTLIGGKIVITVAHRLSTIQKVNKIVVLKHGRIIGEGNFQKLMDSNSYFRKLVESQNLKN